VDDLVAIARIAKPRGIRGEVVAEVLTDFPERFENLEEVFLLKPNRERLSLKIEEAWFQNNRIVLKFENFDSIEQAETLRDCEVCVNESDAVELSGDAVYEWKLIGCAVETLDGKPLGKVSEIMRTGAAQILVVAGGEKEYLIPFAKKICVEVDVEKKIIRVDPPEGLLDF
jgi:16S rRNA processing protein RimM